MDAFDDPTPIATAEQYKTALQALRDEFVRERPFSSSQELRMLKAHYQAPGATITATALAEQVEYKSHKIASTRYGTLAARIAAGLDYTVARPKGPKGGPDWWGVLAYRKQGAAPTKDGFHEWVLRPELCAALEQLRWASKPADVPAP